MERLSSKKTGCQVISQFLVLSECLELRAYYEQALGYSFSCFQIQEAFSHAVFSLNPGCGLSPHHSQPIQKQTGISSVAFLHLTHSSKASFCRSLLPHAVIKYFISPCYILKLAHQFALHVWLPLRHTPVSVLKRQLSARGNCIFFKTKR